MDKRQVDLFGGQTEFSNSGSFFLNWGKKKKKDLIIDGMIESNVTGMPVDTALPTCYGQAVSETGGRYQLLRRSDTWRRAIKRSREMNLPRP